MTATDLITRALRLIGVVAASETPSAEDLDTAFDALNDWLGTLATMEASVYELIRTTKTLADGTASYTIGTGGSINIVRPVEIAFATLVLDTSAATPIEREIRVYTDGEWAAIPQKTLTGSPAHGIFYDHAWTAGLGTISIYPIPDVGTTQLVLYTPRAIAAFADLTTDYTFPPGYARALRYNLALELAPEFDATPSASVERIARESLAQIKRQNFRPFVPALDPALAGLGGRYDITSDGYR